MTTLLLGIAPGGDMDSMTIRTGPSATSEQDEFAELVGRTAGMQPWRRVFHAANGAMLAYGPGALGLSRFQTVLALAALTMILLAADVARLRAPDLNMLFFRAFPSLVSPREAAKIASSTWYVVGALLVWAFFPAPVAMASILVLALADPSASVLGRLVNSPRVGTGTVFGCFVFFTVASVILLPIVGFPTALLVAAGVMVVEALPWKVDDNVAVPLATAVLLTVLIT
jgi:dolichol kinase